MAVAAIIKHVATVSEFLTVGASHTCIPDLKRLLLAASSRFCQEERAVRKALTAATNYQPAYLRGDFHVRGIRVGLRHVEPFEAQALQVKLDGLLHVLFDFFARLPGRNATFQVGRIRGISRRGLFDDHQVFFHGFKPACFRMLFKVPGASSSLRLPGIVTSPGLVGCLY